MIGDVKMQTIKLRTGRSLTGDRLLFLVLSHIFDILFQKFQLQNSLNREKRAKREMLRELAKLLS